METSLAKISTGLEDADKQGKQLVDQLYARIEQTHELLAKINSACYSDSGANYDVMSVLPSFDWYSKGSNVTLQIMFQEKPFGYMAGDVSIAEDQWVIGFSEDIYAYAEYTFMGAEGSLNIENGTLFAEGACSVLEGNVYFQVTDYLKTQADLTVCYAEGSVEIGKNGIHLHGEVGVLSANVQTVVGTENCNVSINGSAKVLTASGDVAFEFNSADGTYKAGAKGEAAFGAADASIGFNVMGFGLEVGVGAKAGAGGGIWSESSVVVAGDYVNLNSSEFDLGGALGLDIDVKITVPYLYPKWDKIFGF